MSTNNPLASSPHALEQYLQEHIPLSSAMQVSVRELLEERVSLTAPLAPNINHRETVFGGSVSAVGILAAWSLLHTRLVRAGVDCRLVIQRNTMQYLLPIDADFSACATLSEAEKWDSFLRLLERKGRARIAVTVRLDCDGKHVGQLDGEFVALGKDT